MVVSLLSFILFYHWVNNLTKSVATLNVFCYTTTISLNLFKDSTYGEKFKENEANVFIGLTVNWFRSALLAAAFLVQLLLSLSPLIRLTDFTQCKLTAANYAKVKRNTNRYVHKRTHIHMYFECLLRSFYFYAAVYVVLLLNIRPHWRKWLKKTHTHICLYLCIYVLSIYFDYRKLSWKFVSVCRDKDGENKLKTQGKW